MSDFYRLVKQIHPIELSGGLKSTLYVMQVGQNHRLVISVYHDPVFRQIILTLFRAIPTSEAVNAYRDTMVDMTFLMIGKRYDIYSRLESSENS